MVQYCSEGMPQSYLYVARVRMRIVIGVPGDRVAGWSSIFLLSQLWCTSFGTPPSCIPTDTTPQFKRWYSHSVIVSWKLN